MTYRLKVTRSTLSGVVSFCAVFRRRIHDVCDLFKIWNIVKVSPPHDGTMYLTKTQIIIIRQEDGTEKRETDSSGCMCIISGVTIALL